MTASVDFIVDESVVVVTSIIAAVDSSVVVVAPAAVVSSSLVVVVASVVVVVVAGLISIQILHFKLTLRQFNHSSCTLKLDLVMIIHFIDY